MSRWLRRSDSLSQPHVTPERQCRFVDQVAHDDLNAVVHLHVQEMFAGYGVSE